MKKIFLMLVVISAFTFAGYAQTTNTTPVKTTPVAKDKGGKHETPEQRAQKSVNKLDSIVGLTADQKTQVYNLAITRAKNVDVIREKYKGQSDKTEQGKQEIQSAHKEYHSSVKKLLTPDQMNKLKEYQQANKANGTSKQGNEDLPTEKD